MAKAKPTPPSKAAAKAGGKTRPSVRKGMQGTTSRVKGKGGKSKR